MNLKSVRFISKTAVLALLFLLQSCLVENDMSYPTVIGDITAFEVSGQKSVKIDKDSRTVEVVLEETADITSLEVLDFAVSEGAVCETVAKGVSLDLSSPLTVLLKTYQEYKWTIKAVQPIERYVKCEGQVGESRFDLKSKMVIVPVSDKLKWKEITFTDMKLEPEGSVVTFYEDSDEGGRVSYKPVVGFPLTLDCVLWRYFIVEYKGQKIRWGVKVIKEETSLSVTEVNAWAKKAEVSGSLAESGTVILKYRKSGTESWSELSEVRTEGANFNATLTGLSPLTKYEVKAVVGDIESPAFSFETEDEAILPNLSFDAWIKGETGWFPNATDDESSPDFIWDSANTKTAGISVEVTTPEETVVAVSGSGKKAARLESASRFGTFAAGNIYTGNFGKAIMSPLGAILKWGVPFKGRPLALKGYYHYKPKTIDKTDKDHAHLKGQTDIGQIQIMLTTWSAPFDIDTANKKFVDVNAPEVIAYATMDLNETSAYEPFELKLDYRDTAMKPTYIVIVGASSKYGDFFTGAVGTVLYLDEFELVY